MCCLVSVWISAEWSVGITRARLGVKAQIVGIVLASKVVLVCFLAGV